ncbi:MAG: hypothetical protein Q8N99_01495 [Nanoarchaeota archaeon]|nr:hypothetical protein [Nanoarchaeota archaeon]
MALDIKQIESEIIEETKQGKLLFPESSALGGIKDVIITNIKGPSLYVTPSDYPLEGKEVVEIAVDCVNGLQDYLKVLVSQGFLYTPELIINPQENPFLQSFQFNQKVFIRPVKDCGDRFVIYGKVYFNIGISADFTFNKDYLKSSRFRRGYSVQGNRFNVERSEILFRIYQDDIGKCGTLAMEVLSQQLEPITSSRLKRICKDREIKEKRLDPNLLSSLAHIYHYEEGLVAKTIVKSFLYKNRERFGLNNDDIVSWSPRGYNLDDYKAMQQVQKHGPDIAIAFYSFKSWNLDEFLDGSFAKRFEEK